MSSPAPIRISSRTGKPVRKYVRKNIVDIPVPVTPFKPPSNVVKESKMTKQNSMKIEESWTFRIYGEQVWFFRYPTANCQVASIAAFHVLIRRSTDLKEQLKQFPKNAILVNFKQDLKYQFYKKLDKKYIIFQEDYVSTNESKMCMILINNKKIRNGK